MKVLFDQGVPAPLRDYLEHHVDTAFEMGWSTLENGQLLEAARSAGYSILITTDQNLEHQQISQRTGHGHYRTVVNLMASDQAMYRRSMRRHRGSGNWLLPKSLDRLIRSAAISD